MIEQNYARHSQYVKPYHYVLMPLVFIGLITSLVNVYLQWAAHFDMLNSILIALLFICATIIAIYMRQFPLRAQDRVIRAEENFRHYILANKPLDSRITMQQIIALRFAHDDEFIILADRAAKENLSPIEIKKDIKKWRADHFRM